MRTVNRLVADALACGSDFNTDTWNTYVQFTHIYIPCGCGCVDGWTTWAIVQLPPGVNAPTALQTMRGMVPADELVVVTSMTTIELDDDNDAELPLQVLALTNRHVDVFSFAHVHDDTVDFWFMPIGGTVPTPAAADNPNVTDILKGLRR